MTEVSIAKWLMISMQQLHYYFVNLRSSKPCFTLKNQYLELKGDSAAYPRNAVCATSKGSDQSLHMRSLIRAFASRLNILCLVGY